MLRNKFHNYFDIIKRGNQLVHGLYGKDVLATHEKNKFGILENLMSLN